MKSEVGLAKAAAKALRDAAEPSSSNGGEEESSQASQASRAATIAAMTGVLRQRKQKKRTRFVAITSSLAVAAVIALAVGGRAVLRARDSASAASTSSTKTNAAPPMVAASFVRGTPVVVRGNEHVTLTDGTPLRAGDHVSVGSGSRMTIGFAQGTHVAIDDHAELDMTSAAPRTAFQLTSGSVRADVAKLFPGESFVIHTSDAEVEVHGTSFEVTRVDDSDPSSCNKKTRVRVREGVVAVRSAGKETLVRANEVWPTCEVPTTVATPTPPTAAPKSDVTGAGAVRPSDLAAQNDLFEAAISKKRAGDSRGAVTTLEDLLARYPQSHLAQSARAERMKLLRTMDRDRARTAAQDYLKRYPTGFARRDAEVILEEKN
jgi:hypothetical protein